MGHGIERRKVSQRRPGRILGQPRGYWRHCLIERSDWDTLTERIVSLACQYGRYGYRRITAMLNRGGLMLGMNRVSSIGRREGLKVPARQRPRAGLWLGDGSCVRLRSENPHHAWSYHFVTVATHDGRSAQLLTLIDEFTHECVSIKVSRRMGKQQVIRAPADLMLIGGVLTQIRIDNGPEFTAKALGAWLQVVSARTLYIEPGSPWENDYCDSLNGRLWDKLLNGRTSTL